MWYAFAFYWIVCGFATFGAGPEPLPGHALRDFLIALVVGGFVIPAKFVQNCLRNGQ